MSDTNQLTKSQYAEYRGVSKPMVSKWYSDGRLVMTPDERFVLVKESDDRIKLTASLNGSFYDQKAKKEREEINKSIEDKGLLGLTEVVSYQQLDLQTEDAEVLFKNARALREKAAALQAAAEHEKFIGQLIEREQVDKVIFERARQFRDGLITLSRRIAPDLASINDVKQIELMLNKEHRLILEQFSKLPVIDK